MRGWTNEALDGGLIHKRRGAPDRWDIRVSRVWSGQGSPVSLDVGRLLRSIRQDLWRDLQNLRGFIPRMMAVWHGEDLHITAGGVLLAGRPAPDLTARVAAVLDDRQLQARWRTYAAKRGRCSRRS